MRMSSKAKGYDGANPFREAQARSFGDDKIASEFFATSLFWSLFNEQHEILLGTRGSGKTVLLKMLTYSCLRRISKTNEKAAQIVTNKAYIGCYVPTHLEYVRSLPGESYSPQERLAFFEFSLNCRSAMSFLSEVECLLEDCSGDDKRRLLLECKVVDDIGEIWFPDKYKCLTTIDQLKREIEVMDARMSFDTLRKHSGENIFARGLFQPILRVLRRVSHTLDIDYDKLNCLICIDEAEFLDDLFQRSINHIMRSDKKPLVIKMATLPFKHTTRETLLDGVFAEARGNDFNYRIVDHKVFSEEFKNLCNHLCRVRLARCSIYESEVDLEAFLGTTGNDDMIDYFRLELPRESAEDVLVTKIVEELSDARKKHVREMPKDQAEGDFKHAIIKKFGPLYYVRRMKQLNSQGNTTAGWFAGARTVRNVADGNPRRFIQAMNALFERATEKDLTNKEQQRVLMEFCQGEQDASESFPVYGPLVRELIQAIAVKLARRIHGPSMVNGACGFILGQGLLNATAMRNAFQMAAAYSHLIFSESQILNGIKEGDEVRLSFLYAVTNWLPMRDGDPITIRPGAPVLCEVHDQERREMNKYEAQRLIGLLNLGVDNGI